MKAITLVRVSTKNQTYDEQSRQVYQMALNDGYREEDIIQIEEKESGYLDEDDRRGLTKLKEEIETDNTINCVYCWEVSRLARRKKVGFSMLDFLSQRGINLKVYTPRMELLNADGSINDGMEMAFVVCMQTAESELRAIRARAKRAIEQRRREGKLTNNMVKWGYKRENGRAVVNEEEAALVRFMFEEYANGTTLRQIVRQLKALGKEIDAHNLTRDIHFPYCGNETYPQIISKELWNKCQDIANNKNTWQQRDTHRIYFGKGILHCTHCGRAMSTVIINAAYRCKECGKENFSINAVDSCLWHTAKILYGGHMAEEAMLTQEKYEATINRYNQSIEQYSKKINHFNKRKDTLEESYYIQGSLSKEKFDKFMKQIQSEIDSCENEINYFNHKIEDLHTLYRGQRSRGYSVEELSKLEDEDKQQICHDMIEGAECTKLSKSEFILTVYPKALTKADAITYKCNMYKRLIESNDIYMEGFILMDRFKATKKH